MSPYFKPETSALVLIDHQVGTMQFIKNIPSDVALRNAVALAKAAKSFGMPILMTTSQEDHVQGPTADALQRVAPEAYAARIKRTGVVNAWSDPAFRDAVLGLGRRQLVMAAVTTDICLVFPAISADRHHLLTRLRAPIANQLGDHGVGRLFASAPMFPVD